MFTSGSRGKGSSKASGSQATRQMHGNLEQNEDSAFIKYKHLEHGAQKQLIDPRAHRVPTHRGGTKLLKTFKISFMQRKKEFEKYARINGMDKIIISRNLQIFTKELNIICHFWK